MAKLVDIFYPDMSCCLCGGALPPGSKAAVHPSMKGPRGGKKYAHSQCMGGAASNRRRAKKNPICDFYRCSKEAVGPAPFADLAPYTPNACEDHVVVGNESWYWSDQRTRPEKYKWLRESQRERGHSLMSPGSGPIPNPTSRRNPRQSDVKLFQKVLAHLRALQWVYTTSHWTSAGPNAYGDHLLLERLYTGLDKPIDALGERMVAYFGPQAVDPVAINGIVQKVLAGVGPARLRLSILLNLEHSTQTVIKTAWKANQESGDEMSLGIDDFLMSLANERDTAIYLLKQRLGE